MTFDWRREYERQHGKLPETGTRRQKNPRSPSNRGANAGGEAWQGGVPQGNRPSASAETTGADAGAGAEPAGHEGHPAKGEADRPIAELPSGQQASPDRAEAPRPACEDCIQRPGIIVDVFTLRGMTVARVKCPTCGRTRRRQGGGA